MESDAAVKHECADTAKSTLRARESKRFRRDVPLLAMHRTELTRVCEVLSADASPASASGSLDPRRSRA
eukprot:5089286-Amphidinium_carterae.1